MKNFRSTVIGVGLCFAGCAHHSGDRAGDFAGDRAPASVREVRAVDEELIVEPAYVDFSGPTGARFEAESKRLKEIFARKDTRRLWDRKWKPPRNAEVSSRFGLRRSYNGGVYKNVHNGVDLRGDYDDPVRAPAAGRVILVDDLLITGKTVVLDHGGGVYSLYAHLLEASVRVGQRVKPGTRLGGVGDSGRATGPHLHWSVVVDGVYVDPIQFLEMSGK